MAPEQPEIIQRFTRIERVLATLVDKQTQKDFYTVEEFAKIVGRAEFTCREWCRHGRIKGQKRNSGRGKFCSWVISHDELLRYQREGLLAQR